MKAEGFMKIVSRPAGGAPEEIRDQWIGLILPVAYVSDDELEDVVTHRKVGRRGGIAVNWNDAMRVLGEVSPQAQKWWKTHISPATLIFAEECCEMVPD